MVRTLRPFELSKIRKVRCKTLSGARVEEVFETTKSLANTFHVSELILHVGTNNVATCENGLIEKLTESLCDQVLADCPSVTSITISSVILIQRKIYQNDLREKTIELNKQLRALTHRRGWGFIDNSSIDPSTHLGNDGVHLNVNGTKTFATACCRLTLIDILQPTNPAPPHKTCLNLIVTPLPCTKTLRVSRPADHTLTSPRKARYPWYRVTPNAIGQKFIAGACPLPASYTHGMHPATRTSARQWTNRATKVTRTLILGASTVEKETIYLNVQTVDTPIHWDVRRVDNGDTSQNCVLHELAKFRTAAKKTYPLKLLTLYPLSRTRTFSIMS